jgi:hypothetical protein
MPCFGDYVPTVEEVNGQFTVSMAANEIEPVQIGIYVPQGAEPLKRVSLGVQIDIPCRVGMIHHESYREHWRPIDKGRWYTDYPGGRQSLPLYLVPGNTMTEIKPGHTAAFWITFKPAGKIASGIHKGSFTLTIPGQETRRYPLQVEIHPFSLPRPDVTFNIYARPDRIPRYYQRKYQEMYARDMAEHGHNSGQIVSFFDSFANEEYLKTGKLPLPSTAGQWIEPWTCLLDPGEVADGKVDPERLVEAQVEMMQRAGLAQEDVPLIMVQGNWRCENKPLIMDTFRRFAIEKGWPEIMFYTRDEPPHWRHGPSAIPDITTQAMLDFKRIKNGRSYTALSGHGAVIFGHFHDVWIVLAGQITPELIQEARRQGAKIWTYSERLRITNLRSNRYYAGLYTWGLGLDGNTTYAYGHYVFQPKNGEGAQDPVWSPPHGRTTMHVINGYVIPGPNGPIPGMGFEGRREGIDDYRYLQLLEARLAAADPNLAAAKEASLWLDSLKQQIVAESLEGVYASGYQHGWELDWVEPSPNIGPTQYASLRDTAAGFILQLSEAPGELNPPRADREFIASGWEGEDFLDKSAGEIGLALQHGSSSLQRAAATALIVVEIDDDGVQEVVPALIALVEKPDVCLPAINALGAIGPRAAMAVPALERGLENPDPIVRCGSLLALHEMGPAGVDGLILGLQDPFLMNKTTAADCLQRIGPAAVKALPALEAAKNSPNENEHVARTMQGAIDAIHKASN